MYIYFRSVEQMARGKKMVLLRYMSNNWKKGECGSGESPNGDILIGKVCWVEQFLS